MSPARPRGSSEALSDSRMPDSRGRWLFTRRRASCRRMASSNVMINAKRNRRHAGVTASTAIGICTSRSALLDDRSFNERPFVVALVLHREDEISPYSRAKGVLSIYPTTDSVLTASQVADTFVGGLPSEVCRRRRLQIVLHELLGDYPCADLITVLLMSCFLLRVFLNASNGQEEKRREHQERRNMSLHSNPFRISASQCRQPRRRTRQRPGGLVHQTCLAAGETIALPQTRGKPRHPSTSIPNEPNAGCFSKAGALRPSMRTPKARLVRKIETIQEGVAYQDEDIGGPSAHMVQDIGRVSIETTRGARFESTYTTKPQEVLAGQHVVPKDG